MVGWLYTPCGAQVGQQPRFCDNPKRSVYFDSFFLSWAGRTVIVSGLKLVGDEAACGPQRNDEQQKGDAKDEIPCACRRGRLSRWLRFAGSRGTKQGSRLVRLGHRDFDCVVG